MGQERLLGWEQMDTLSGMPLNLNSLSLMGKGYKSGCLRWINFSCWKKH